MDVEFAFIPQFDFRKRIILYVFETMKGLSNLLLLAENKFLMLGCKKFNCLREKTFFVTKKRFTSS